MRRIRQEQLLELVSGTVTQENFEGFVRLWILKSPLPLQGTGYVGGNGRTVWGGRHDFRRAGRRLSVYLSAC